MDAFVLISVYLVIVMVLSGSLCKECKASSSMDDDEIYYYNNSVPLESYNYCFVNECTIRIKESNVLLNVINNTGDWVIATNTTNTLTIFINGSINNCSSDARRNTYQTHTPFYVIQVIVCIVGIIVAVANISMHFIFKELLTVPGILIIILCISTCAGFVIAVTHITIYYHWINIPAKYCTLFISYMYLSNANTYEATRMAFLIHLAYTMYRGYRASGGEENKRSLLCKYFTFIIVASTVSSAIVITVDATTNRKAFDTADRRCLYIFDDFDQNERILSVISQVATLLIWLFIQVILVTIIFVLYILTTKKCCARSSTSRDLRVSVVLIASADLNLITFIVLLLSHTSIHIVTLVGLTIIAIGQVTLFTLFASSSKVMQCCKEDESQRYTKSSTT